MSHLNRDTAKPRALELVPESTRNGKPVSAPISSFTSPAASLNCAIPTGACSTETTEAASSQNSLNLPGVIYSAIVQLDGTRVFSCLSEGIRDLVGLQAQEAIAHPSLIPALIHPDDRVPFDAILKLSITTLSDFYHDYRLITPEGSVKWVHEQARFSQRDTGEIVMDGIILPTPNRTVRDESHTSRQSRTQAHQSVTPPSAERKSRESQEQFLRQTVEKIAQNIHQSLVLEDILNVAVADVRQMIGADRVVIAQWLSDDRLVTAAESVKSQYRAIEQSRMSHTWLKQWGETYRKGSPQVIHNINHLHLHEESIAAVKRQQIKAAIAAPITVQGDLWGVLITHQCGEPRTWQMAEVDALKQLASHVGIAIHHAGLYQQLHRSNMELERKFQVRNAQLQIAFEFEATLKRITDKVRDSLDEDQILQAAVRELTTAIGVSGCNAALYDLDKGTSTICYEYTTSVSPYYGRVAHINSFPEIYDQLFRGHVFQFCSIVPNPVRGHVAMLTCPIMDDQEVLGDLWLINHKFYAFSEQDIRLVQLVASQCAIALRQARLYKAAQAQVAELGRLNQLKDDFLSTVSHELRTPIASIKMASQMLELTLNKMGLLDEKTGPTARYLQILQGECNREINLVNDLLNLSRLDAEAEPLNLGTVTLKTWLADLVEPFTERADKQQQTLKLSVTSDAASVIVDSSKLERVLTELLHNACKYTPDKEHIGLNVTLSGKMLQIQIQNTGVEIPEQERLRIFEKFYRIPNMADRWKHGGTGLGLALVKKLIEQLHGSINVDSSNGATTFSVLIPVEPSNCELSPSA